MDGVMTKEFVFEEFKKLETNQQKAKYLRELKETKQKYPKTVSIKISLKQQSKTSIQARKKYIYLTNYFLCTYLDKYINYK